MLVTSFISIVAIFLKFRTEATWSKFKDPLKFYRKLIRLEFELGQVDEEKREKILANVGY